MNHRLLKGDEVLVHGASRCAIKTEYRGHVFDSDHGLFVALENGAVEAWDLDLATPSVRLDHGGDRVRALLAPSPDRLVARAASGKSCPGSERAAAGRAHHSGRSGQLRADANASSAAAQSPTTPTSTG